MYLSGATYAPVVSVAALLDSINPCAFSVLFLTIAFLMSMNAGRREVLRIGGAYIVGIFVAYLGIGLGILKALSVLGVPHIMSTFGSLLIIAIGLWSIVGALFPQAKVALGIPQRAHRSIAVLMERASVPAALLLGMFVGVCEFPCTGGPYLMILGLLHDESTFYQGLGYLIWYNLIFVSPLIIALFVAGDERIIVRMKEWRHSAGKSARIYAGIAMILLGTILLVV